jgi:tRNA(fMet)-specific endonuclease VapC
VGLITRRIRCLFLSCQSTTFGYNPQQRFLSLFVSLPFDDRAAEHYGRIRADLANAGMPIGGNDLLIAAIALTHNLSIVTHNVKEFGRVTSLQIEDWEAQP